MIRSSHGATAGWQAVCDRLWPNYRLSTGLPRAEMVIANASILVAEPGKKQTTTPQLDQVPSCGFGPGSHGCQILSLRLRCSPCLSSGLWNGIGTCAGCGWSRRRHGAPTTRRCRTREKPRYLKVLQQQLKCVQSSVTKAN